MHLRSQITFPNSLHSFLRNYIGEDCQARRSQLEFALVDFVDRVVVCVVIAEVALGFRKQRNLGDSALCQWRNVRSAAAGHNSVGPNRAKQVRPLRNLCETDRVRADPETARA